MTNFHKILRKNFIFNSILLVIFYLLLKGKFISSYIITILLIDYKIMVYKILQII